MEDSEGSVLSTGWEMVVEMVVEMDAEDGANTPRMGMGSRFK
jgi:hypothetical protein